MRKLIIGLVLGAVLAATTVAIASIPESSGTIHACRNTKDGSLRAIDTDAGQTCVKDEEPLSWNQTGPEGPQGPAGPGSNIQLLEHVEVFHAGDTVTEQDVADLTCPAIDSTHVMSILTHGVTQTNMFANASTTFPDANIGASVTEVYDSTTGQWLGRARVGWNGGNNVVFATDVIHFWVQCGGSEPIGATEASSTSTTATTAPPTTGPTTTAPPPTTATTLPPTTL